jgi:hypothetical protein
MAELSAAETISEDDHRTRSAGVMKGERKVNDEVLIRQVEKQFESLRSEFADMPPEAVRALAEAQYGRLRADAKFGDFIPVLVHRYTRETLLRIRRDELHSAA